MNGCDYSKSAGQDPNCAVIADGVKANLSELPAAGQKATGYRYISFIRARYVNQVHPGQPYDPALAKPANPQEWGAKYQTWNQKYNVYAMGTNDGLSFYQLGGAAVFEAQHDNWTMYDPHVATDATGSRYVMSMECAEWNTFGASLCVSESTTPWIIGSWSAPRLVVQNNGLKSASTGAALLDEGRQYVKWTMVDDGNISEPQVNPRNIPAGTVTKDEGNESTSTWALEVPQLRPGFGQSGQNIFAGLSGNIGVRIMTAEPNTKCTSLWDCNNRDIQDWKKIGGYYYAIYNGANYFRCWRPTTDAQAGFKSKWALAIRRSRTPLGNYNESSGILVAADVDDVCGVSYPSIAVLGGVTYMYYDHYFNGSNPKAWSIDNRRSRLVWIDAGTPGVGARPEPMHGDIGGYPDAVRLVRDRVVESYRRFLGREPESEAVVRQHIAAALTQPDYETYLLRAFYGSPEFQNRAASIGRAAAVTAIYRAVLLREFGPGGLDFAINSNLSYDQLFENLLGSNETLGRRVFRYAYLRDWSSGEADVTMNYLNNGGSLFDFRRDRIVGPPGQAALNGIFVEQYGRLPTSDEAANARNAVIQGGSLSSLRRTLANYNGSAIQSLLSATLDSKRAAQFDVGALAQRIQNGEGFDQIHDSLIAAENSRAMSGALNGAFKRDGRWYVSGWACLPDNQGPLAIQALIGATIVNRDLTRLPAYASETSMKQACNGGSFVNHRFEIEIPQKALAPYGASKVALGIRALHPMSGAALALLKDGAPLSIQEVDFYDSQIQSLYANIMGRAPTASELASARTVLTANKTAAAATTLANSLANSKELAALIKQMYLDTLGAAPTAELLAGAISNLAKGKTTLADFRSYLANHGMTIANLTAAYKTILGRDMTASEKAANVKALAAGTTSVASIRNVLASSVAITGSIDKIAMQGGQPYLLGWACAKTKPASIAVDVYVGADSAHLAMAVRAKANVASEAAVGNACQDSTATPHRFSVLINPDIQKLHAGKAIYVYGLTPVSGLKNLPIAHSGELKVPADGALLFEAENATGLASSAVQTSGARKFVELNSSGTKILNFPINLEKAGKYRILAKTLASTGGMDSFMLMSSKQTIAVRVAKNADWVESYGLSQALGVLAEISLPAGASTLSVKVRESGLKLDGFALEPIHPCDGLYFEADAAPGLAASSILTNADGSRAVELNAAKVKALSFPITLTKAGKYRIYAKTLAPNGSTDSFVLASSLQSVKVRVRQDANWLWDYGYAQDSTAGAVAEISLPAGKSTLSLKVRESGFKIDAFILEKQ